MQELRGEGISCAAYHADLDPAVRESVHRRWSQGQLQVRLGGRGLRHSLSSQVQPAPRFGQACIEACAVLKRRVSTRVRRAGRRSSAQRLHLAWVSTIRMCALSCTTPSGARGRQAGWVLHGRGRRVLRGGPCACCAGPNIHLRMLCMLTAPPVPACLLCVSAASRLTTTTRSAKDAAEGGLACARCM